MTTPISSLTRRRSLALLTPLLVIVGAASFTACGGSGGPAANAEIASLKDDGPTDSAADSGPDGASESSTPELDAEAAMLAYTECMRGEGIDLPDPEFASGGMTIAAGAVSAADTDDEASTFEEPTWTQEEFTAAASVCDPLLADVFGDVEIDPAAEAEMREQMLAFAQCMRENGVDMPDPEFSGGGVSIQIGSAEGDADGAQIDDETFEAANEACIGDGPIAIGASPMNAAGDS